MKEVATFWTAYKARHMSFHQNLLQFVATQSFQKPQWISVKSVEGIKDLDMKQSTFVPAPEGLTKVVKHAWQLKINRPKTWNVTARNEISENHLFTKLLRFLVVQNVNFQGCCYEFLPITPLNCRFPRMWPWYRHKLPESTPQLFWRIWPLKWKVNPSAIDIPSDPCMAYIYIYLHLA